MMPINLSELPIAEGRSAEIKVFGSHAPGDDAATCIVVDTATLPFEQKQHLLSHTPLRGVPQGALGNYPKP